MEGLDDARHEVGLGRVEVQQSQIFGLDYVEALRADRWSYADKRGGKQ